jgi:hypothetical protein
LGERLLCKQEVIGSIPFTSTIAGHHRRAPSWPSMAGHAPGAFGTGRVCGPAGCGQGCCGAAGAGVV